MVQIVTGNLLDQDVDIIVNPWNHNIIPWWLLLPQGVSGAIRKKAGPSPFKELAKKGYIPLGGAVLTSAGRLPYKGIIHVAGINMFWHATEKSIRLSIQNAMKIAEEQNFRSVAFPVIGAGTGSFNRNKALEIINEELARMNHEIEIVVVNYHKDR